MPCKVAVSSAPMGTSRWTTSATVTSGTGGGGGAVFAVHPAPSAATAATRERGEQREAWSLLGEVTGDPPRRSPTFGNDTAEIGLGTYPPERTGSLDGAGLGDEELRLAETG